MDHNYTMMTSAQKQKEKAISLWRVLSDAFRIITSNPLHFLSLSLILFIIFPIIIIIPHDDTLTEEPTPTSFQYHESFLSNKTPSTSNSSLYSYTSSTEQPQILFLFLYDILLQFFTEKPLLIIALLIKLCSVAPITHSIFNGIHNKPLKLSSSLKSIPSSFFPLLVTKFTQALIVAATFVVLAVGLLSTAIDIFGLRINIGVASNVNVIVFSVVMLICDGLVGLLLVDVVAVAESKYGVAPFGRSSSLVKGKRVVALMIIFLFQVLPSILSVLFMILEANITGGGGAGLMLLRVLLYVVVYPLASLFYLAANTVFYVHCKNQLGQGAHVENDEDDEAI